MAFHCVIVTPEEQILDASVTQVILPAHDGKIGILTNRAPLLVKLGVGVLHLDLAGGQKRDVVVDSGVAQMKDNNLTVLTQIAVTPEQVDAETTRAELAEATARKPIDAATTADRQRTIARANAKLELVRK